LRKIHAQQCQQQCWSSILGSSASLEHCNWRRGFELLRRVQLSRSVKFMLSDDVSADGGFRMCGVRRRKVCELLRRVQLTRRVKCTRSNRLAAQKMNELSLAK
jgi:hypothetical protein